MCIFSPFHEQHRNTRGVRGRKHYKTKNPLRYYYEDSEAVPYTWRNAVCRLLRCLGKLQACLSTMPEYKAPTQAGEGTRSTSSTTTAIDNSATKICREQCGLSSLPSPRPQRQRWPIYFLLSLSIILLVVNLTIPYANSQSPSSQPVITSGLSCRFNRSEMYRHFLT